MDSYQKLAKRLETEGRTTMAAGTPVNVVKDNGEIVETVTRSAPWALGDGLTVKEPAIMTGFAEDAPTYDDHQAEAVLVQCAKCGHRFYMTIPAPVCGRCQQKGAK